MILYFQNHTIKPSLHMCCNIKKYAVSKDSLQTCQYDFFDECHIPKSLVETTAG